ncbi:MAG TPA: FAD:protein FMN transferase [Thermoanaerobaculia bacterium]|jgi:thiamine biosynthesis lipoprotein
MTESDALYTTRFPLMGGGALVQFVDGRGRANAERIARAVEDEARRIEVKFSRYRETSIVSEINRNAGRTPVAVDEETDDLVRIALELSDLTGGRFDPTVGALRRAWDFKAERVPTAAEIDALLPLVDASAVSRRERTIFLRREGMEIDLGGVGKEYAVDRAARLLREEGVRSAVVSFSGDVRTIGSRGDGRPWKVGVVDPRCRDRCRFAVRPLSDAGVATSGDYERGFAKDGVRYHHILDARTGWPARGLASVTVVAATAFRAGCYATASFLLGPADGLELLEKAENVEGALITEGGEILTTTGMWLLSDLPGGAWEGCREV